MSLDARKGMSPKLSRFSQAEFAEQASTKIQLLSEVLALSLQCDRGILPNKVTLLIMGTECLWRADTQKAYYLNTGLG